jgi:hypothetical protein
MILANIRAIKEDCIIYQSLSQDIYVIVKRYTARDLHYSVQGHYEDVTDLVQMVRSNPQVQMTPDLPSEAEYEAYILGIGWKPLEIYLYVKEHGSLDVFLDLRVYEPALRFKSLII